MAENPVKFSDLFDPLGPGAQELKDFTSAVQGLSRNYKSFVKTLDSDGQRVKVVLDGVAAQAGTLREQATSINLLNEKERAGLAALATEAARLVQERQRLEQVAAAQARAQQRVKDATTEATSALRAMQNELREAYKAQDTARIEKAATSLRQYKNETLGLSAALRGANSEFSAARGSYDALDAENKKLIASLKALEGGIGSGSGEALRLQKQIAANTQTLKSFDENILVFNRNVGNYKGGFAELVAELAKARAAQAAMAQGSEEYNRQQIKVAGFQTAAQRSAAQMGLSYEQAGDKIEATAAALQPLATSLLRLEREQHQVAQSTGEESEQYRKLGFQIQQTKKQLDDVAVATTQVETKQHGFAQQLGFSREGLQQYVTQLAVGYVGLQALVSGIEAVFSANVEYSRNLAEVRKTTGLSADEAERLAQSLKALDTPTSLAGLLKIASVGGQLGKQGVEDVLEFTKAIDTAVQALGNDGFSGGAEEIATVLGKLSGIFRKDLGPDAAQNILALGSAINELAAQGEATSPVLSKVALDVGAGAAQFNVGAKNVLAYAGTLEKAGFQADVIGSSLSRLFSTLGNKTEAAFKVAQKANPALSLQEFTRLVNTDFNAAIQLFLKGLNAGNASTTEVNKRLSTLKLTSGDAKNAILSLAQNTETFTKYQQIANGQLRDATSLATEAAVNVETLAGSTDKLKNNASELVTTGVLAAILKFLVDFVAFDFKLLAAGFKGIGDAFVYVGEKVGLVDKPLTNYTTGLVDTALATRKQADGNQALLQSYIDLQNTVGRSAAQELEIAQTRARLLKEFGTADVALIQERIDKERERVETSKQGLRNDIGNFDTLIAKEQQRAATLQEILNNAPRAADGRLTQRSDQQAAEDLLSVTNRLTDAQRRRADAVEALKKLGDGVVKQKQQEADATKDEAAAEEQLDRAAQQRAKNRVQALRDELADNQKRIADARTYQTEQGKLFSDRQISEQVFADAVAGSEEYVSQKQRDGAAIRIQIARAEASERLVEAENDRIRQSKKKDISEAELADIQGQYAARRVEISRKEARDIEEAYDGLRRSLKVEPLEFKVAGLSDKTLQPVTDNIVNGAANMDKAYQLALTAIAGRAQSAATILNESFAQGEVGTEEYEDRLLAIQMKATQEHLALAKKFHKETGDVENQASQESITLAMREAEKKRRIIQQSFATTQSIADAFFQIGNDRRAAEAEALQNEKDRELTAAGENAELKAKIEEDYRKRELAAKRKQAQYDKAQALFNVALNTAMAVTSVLSTGGGTRYADFGISAGILSALVIASGVAQAVAIAAKPLPAYFKGRAGGPAETALVGERGAELIGQPRTGFRLAAQPTITRLEAGDRVYTAPETRQILAQNELFEGRLVQRAQQADAERQTQRLRSGAAAQQAAALASQRAESQILVDELRQVRRAIEQQEYYRLNENDDLVRRSRRDNGWTDYVNKRYKHGRG